MSVYVRVKIRPLQPLPNRGYLFEFLYVSEIVMVKGHNFGIGRNNLCKCSHYICNFIVALSVTQPKLISLNPFQESSFH